jgi:hypothetical protein
MNAKKAAKIQIMTVFVSMISEIMRKNESANPIYCIHFNFSTLIRARYSIHVHPLLRIFVLNNSPHSYLLLYTSYKTLRDNYKLWLCGTWENIRFWQTYRCILHFNTWNIFSRSLIIWSFFSLPFAIVCWKFFLNIKISTRYIVSMLYSVILNGITIATSVSSFVRG